MHDYYCQIIDTSKLTFWFYHHSSCFAAHISVERKRRRKHKPNVYIDNRGHADWQEDWEVLEEPNYGKVLSRRRRQHNMRQDINPKFNVKYDGNMVIIYAKT